jgi:tRNA nucleotidyltransferase (CCA-adding enzyme)
VDCFGGQADLERGLIRAVGDPERRFEEDALRMLRALRFAGRLSFSIEADTARAIHAQCRDLARIAPERVFVELKGLLLTPHPSALLLAFPDLFGVILPEVAPLFGFDQHNPHHDADGWTHTARVVDGVEPQVVLRLAALLHDTGKPDCCTRDAQGVGHFYGHETRSAALAHQALLRLRSDTATREQVELLVGLHDRPLPQSLPAMRRLLAQIGPDALSALLALRRADIGGQSDLQREEKLAKLERAAQLLEQAKLQPCWSVAQLAIAGRDLIDLGFSPGPELGKLLHRALSAVMDGQVENTRAALLHWVAQQERDPSAANQK